MKLGGKRVSNPPELWIRKERAFPGIVSVQKFEAAQVITRARQRRFSDDELLAQLRQTYQERGSLSIPIIDESQGTPGWHRVVTNRFGSLRRAYELIGYKPSRDLSFADNRRTQIPLRLEIMRSIESQIAAVGSKVEKVPRSTRLLVNGEFSLAVQLAQAHAVKPLGPLRWCIVGRRPIDILVVVRLDASGQAIDYLILPMFNADRILLSPRNEAAINGFRFDSLSHLFEITQRAELSNDQETGLFADARLVSLLRSEGMTTCPSCLSGIVWTPGSSAGVGRTVLNLVVVRGYLVKLLANRRIAVFLKKVRPDVGDRMVALVGALDAELGLETPWHRQGRQPPTRRAQGGRVG